MTEVMNSDGTPTPLMGEPQLMMMAISGFVLNKNFIMDTKHFSSRFPIGYPAPQGMYYCSVGGKNTQKTIG
jgi:glutamine synthetase